MRLLFSYIKRNFIWIWGILGIIILMAAVMMLNGIAWNEISYGILLILVFLMIIFAVDFFGYRRRCRRLKEMRDSIGVTLEGLPDARDALEWEYQRLLELLFSEKLRNVNESARKERDMMEYYTMWVHQIKTPIAALKLLLQDKQQREDRQEDLQELFRIEQYVEMALQYMRLGSESTDYVIRKLALDFILKEVVHKYARQFIHKKISLKYDSVDMMVLTDEKWLEFAVEQILSNAIKYTNHGYISIYTEHEKGFDDRERYQYLIIEDTGIGICAEDLPRVCEKGYTGYNGHSDKRSTGIGLYLCSRILKKLGHTLTITSREGEGTRVEIGFKINKDGRCKTSCSIMQINL